MKVILLAGGASPEREISLRSAKSIYKALIELNHEVWLVDPALGKNQPETVDDFFNTELNKEKMSVENYLDSFSLDVFKKVDLVFIILHGKWGEDGTVQSILDLMKIKYTGSGVLGSAICIDKYISKMIVRNFGVSTPKGIILSKHEKVSYEKIQTEIGLPCIFKPNDQGSTIGFSIVNDESHLEYAFNEAIKYSDSILIEEYIQGREITVSILEDKALPIVEVKPKHQLYDYECKYTKGMTEYFCPANIDPDLTNLIQEKALTAFKACKCEVFGRVDFILDKNNIPYFLEINTLPGMTDLSLVPMAARAAGISFNELVQKIIDLSLK